MRVAVVLLAALALAGCATRAEREDNRIETVMSKTATDWAACLRQAQGLPANVALKGKADILTPAPPSIEQRMDGRKPTDDDINNLIVVYRDGVAPCRQQALAGAGAAHPSLAAVYGWTYTASDENLGRLLRREATFGQFAEAKARINQEASSRWLQASSSIKSGLATSHANEVQQRQAASAALAQWSQQQQMIIQQQQMINAMNQPRMTNCQYFGTQLQCTTF